MMTDSEEDGKKCAFFQSKGWHQNSLAGSVQNVQQKKEVMVRGWSKQTTTLVRTMT
jgi:hypothetical protein